MIEFHNKFYCHDHYFNNLHYYLLFQLAFIIYKQLVLIVVCFCYRWCGRDGPGSRFLFASVACACVRACVRMPDVTRSDSQRSDASHKPRVSFNRDVHVKRIGEYARPRRIIV